MKEKTLYELIIDPKSRKSKILVAPFKHDDLKYIKCLQSGESDAEYTDEYRLISYDKDFLESKRDKLENKSNLASNKKHPAVNAGSCKKGAWSR